MQTTLGGGNTFGIGLKHDEFLGEDVPSSLMTLIPIKVSATTLRETPKNYSPPIVVYNNGVSDRSVDRTTNNKHMIRGGISNERCKY